MRYSAVMKIIVVHGKHGTARSLALSPLGRVLLSVCLIGIPVLLGGVTGYYIAANDSSAVINQKAAQSWRESLARQQASLDEAKKLVDSRLRGLTAKVAQLQARMVRIDALGEQLVSESGLKEGEFDFSQPPALGGPSIESNLTEEQSAISPLDFIQTIDRLSNRIDNRWQQLDTLQGVLLQEGLAEDAFVSGRPVKWGWMSSAYGHRTDPFTGLQAWHSGLDFAGKEGSDVVASAAGIVTWSGERSGYGMLVEINHGDGYVTRYGHNAENKVKVGDVVKKSQTIALMGNSGRSTGPHVHYEVYKHGRTVDPAAYLRRTYR